MRISGHVYWVNGGSVDGAVLRLCPAAGGDALSSVSDEDGAFSFEPVPAGEWRLGVKHLDGRQPFDVPVTVVADEDVVGLKPEIAHYERTIDQERGTNLLWGFIALLILLLAGWFLAFADKGSEGDGAALLYALEEARDANEVLAEDSGKTTLSRSFARMEERLVARDISVSDDKLRADLTRALGDQAKALDALDLAQSDALTSFKAQTSETLDAVGMGLSKITQGDLRRGAKGMKGMNWLVASNVTLTIFFWAVIGTLVRLIMTVQYYLYKHSFYRQGVFQHFSLLVAVPVMTFAMIKLLSLVNISAEVGSEKAILLDFSNPQIMAIGAFLLALAPWTLWKRLMTISSGIGSGQGQRG